MDCFIGNFNKTLNQLTTLHSFNKSQQKNFSKLDKQSHIIRAVVSNNIEHKQSDNLERKHHQNLQFNFYYVYASRQPLIVHLFITASLGWAGY